MAMVCTLVLFLSCSTTPPSGSVPAIHPAIHIPPGMRAVSIHLDESLSGAPGDHVDVSLTTKQGETSTVLENVQLADVNLNARLVTFMVSSDDAQKVMTASEQGKFRLRMRKSD
jgi:Flp pilus assembly protein CpaB